MITAPKPFNSIGPTEKAAVLAAMNMPLSGYLAGKERGGYFVKALEDAWALKFSVNHAIAVNSATSGLMAAAFAVGLGPGDTFICPAMTMSATAAAPMFTGARPVFFDVEDESLTLRSQEPIRDAKAVFVTNLFGHPARLHQWRQDCDNVGAYLIEDNAQAPFAMEMGRWTGTIGHIGVFSLNIHKPIQCGEGGVIVTDDDALARRMRAFINHGENVGPAIGLNLRMPELCAAVAMVQLRHGHGLVDTRIDQAVDILNAIEYVRGIRIPSTRKGCRNVFYALPFIINNGNRAAFCQVLRDEGVPVVEGYVPPLYRLPAFAQFPQPCPIAQSLHNSRLFYIENCAWDFTPEQIAGIGDAFRKAARIAL